MAQIDKEKNLIGSSGWESTFAREQADYPPFARLPDVTAIFLSDIEMPECVGRIIEEEKNKRKLPKGAVTDFAFGFVSQSHSKKKTSSR